MLRLTRVSLPLLVAAFGAACAGRSAAPCALAPPRPPPAARDTTGHPLSGRVRDARSDAPIAEALVMLLADTAAAARPLRVGRTDPQGWYHLGGAPAGRYFVRIQRLGYFTAASPVQLGDCGEVVVSGPAVSYCGDTHHVYLRPQARF